MLVAHRQDDRDDHRAGGDRVGEDALAPVAAGVVDVGGVHRAERGRLGADLLAVVRGETGEAVGAGPGAPRRAGQRIGGQAMDVGAVEELGEPETEDAQRGGEVALQRDPADEREGRAGIVHRGDRGRGEGGRGARVRRGRARPEHRRRRGAMDDFRVVVVDHPGGHGARMCNAGAIRAPRCIRWLRGRSAGAGGRAADARPRMCRTRSAATTDSSSTRALRSGTGGECPRSATARPRRPRGSRPPRGRGTGGHRRARPGA